MSGVTTTDLSLRDSDRVQILDLYGRCALAVDEGDAAAWTDCFSADGRFTAGEEIDAVGHIELAEFVREHRVGPHGGVRHHITTASVKPTSGGAAGRAYALITLDGNVVGATRYDDELINEDGTWRFSKRVATSS